MLRTKYLITTFQRPEFLGCVSVLAMLVALDGAKAQEITPVPPVSVTAPLSQPNDGSAAAGYRVDNTSVAGPIWGDLPVQDTPYSISVIPAPLIENLQATTPEDIFQVIPQITNFGNYSNNQGFSQIRIRGYTITPATNAGQGQLYDGVPGGIGGFYNTTLEDKERVELLSGTSGFLYGMGQVGGLLNYVLKRPTNTPYASVTFGDNAGANMSVHGDFGGPLNLPGWADGLLGYRINIAGEDGGTPIGNQNIKHEIISGAFDIHLPYDLLVQLNASHSSYQVDGLTPEYSVPSSLINARLYPNPANPALQKAVPWTILQDYQDTGGVKVTWKANDIFTVRAAYDYTRETKQSGLSTNFNTTISDLSGTLKEAAYFNSASHEEIFYHNAGYAFLDASFNTSFIQHKLTSGFSGDSIVFGESPTKYNIVSDAFTTNFYNQYQYGFNAPQVTLSPNASDYNLYNQFQKNYILGDEIKINDKLTILAGANYTFDGVVYYFNGPNKPASGGNDSKALTPTVSMIYKVLPWLTAYGTYQNSLTPGSVVMNGSGPNGRIFTNNGAILPPTLAKEIEGGVKATVGNNLLLTAALFHIDEGDVYTQQNSNNTYTVLHSGRDVHNGIELTATGKVIDDLTIVGGVTILNPRIANDITNPKENGNLPQGVSQFSEKLYAEYRLPAMAEASWLRDLYLTGSFTWASSFYINQPNTLKLPGYAVEGLGFRYETKFYDHPFILRFNVNNIANLAYWQANNSLGAPRTFLATAQIKW